MVKMVLSLLAPCRAWSVTDDTLPSNRCNLQAPSHALSVPHRHTAGVEARFTANAVAAQELLAAALPVQPFLELALSVQQQLLLALPVQQQLLLALPVHQ